MVRLSEFFETKNYEGNLAPANREKKLDMEWWLKNNYKDIYDETHFKKMKEQWTQMCQAIPFALGTDCNGPGNGP